MNPSQIADYFTGDQQIPVLIAVAVVWIGISALGALIGGRDRLPETDPLLGWAVVAIVLTVGGTLAAVPFRFMAMGIGIASLVALALVFNRDRMLLTPAASRILVLAIPLLLIASAMAASQWDEFSHLLPKARFLVETDGFPNAQAPTTGASYPAYPYAWPFLSYLVAGVAGRFLEDAGGVLNVLLLLSFGLISVRLILRGLDSDTPAVRAGWPLCALGALSVTLFNPTFAQKVVLTAYADVASAVTLGAAGILGWLMLEAEANGERALAARRALHAGLILAVLVVLKQATFVLFAILLVALALAGLRDPGVRFGRLLVLLSLIALPPLLMYGLWRYYVSTELPGREFVIRPFAEWYIDLIPQILLKMLIVLSKKGVYLGLMVLAVVFGAIGLVRYRGPFDRLAIIVGAAFLGYNAFLLWAYIATFGKPDALRVASLWRYNMHLGMLAVAFAALGGGILWRRWLAARIPAPRLAWLPVILFLAAPVGFAHKLRFDFQPPSPHYRAVARDLARIVQPDDKVFILDPTGTGESAMITRFHVAGRGQVAGYLSAFQDSSEKQLRRSLDYHLPNKILVHSLSPVIKAHYAVAMEDGAFYLLSQDAAGTWRIARILHQDRVPVSVFISD